MKYRPWRSSFVISIVIFIVWCVVLGFILTGCAPEEKVVVVNVDTSIPNAMTSTPLGKDTLIEIGDYLWYDQTTRIVYWWNGTLHSSNWATTPSPYYAPNGLPYRYNPETNTFEEIGE